jgi:hypothetical protein
MNSSTSSDDNPGNYRKVVLGSPDQWTGLILGLVGVLLAILFGVLYVYVWDPKKRALKKAKLRREIEEELSFGKVELHSEDIRPPELVGTALGELEGAGPPAREIGGRMVVVVEMQGSGVVYEIEGTVRAELDVD